MAICDALRCRGIVELAPSTAHDALTTGCRLLCQIRDWELKVTIPDFLLPPVMARVTRDRLVDAHAQNCRNVVGVACTGPLAGHGVQQAVEKLVNVVLCRAVGIPLHAVVVFHRRHEVEDGND